MSEESDHVEIMEFKIGQHTIGVQKAGNLTLYLPLMDSDEHRRYFCWSFEAALITRLYYLNHGTMDLLLVNILHELGIKDNQPGTAYSKPQTRLAILATIDGRTVEISRMLGRR